MTNQGGNMHQPTGICRNCKEREATTWWIGEGGTLAYVHGMKSAWCELCAVNAQIDHVNEEMDRLDGLVRRKEELEDAEKQ
jgi:hypothetical protein